ACWGDHFDVQRALKEDGYAKGRRDLLAKHGLQVFAISNHLVGQAVCDVIDERHKSIIPPHVWGDGDPEGVRQRAAKEMQDTARAAAKLGVKVVPGFTGSSIWPLLYSFPPVSDAMIDAGYDDFAKRWNPILDVFDEGGGRVALRPFPLQPPAGVRRDDRRGVRRFRQALEPDPRRLRRGGGALRARGAS